MGVFSTIRPHSKLITRHAEHATTNTRVGAAANTPGIDSLRWCVVGSVVACDVSQASLAALREDESRPRVVLLTYSY